MKNLLKNELRKAIISKYFLLGLALLLLFAMLSGMFMYENRVNYNPNSILKHALDESGNYRTNPDLPIFSFYNSWVGGEAITLYQTIFFYLLPVGAAIPFAWSYHTEKKSGYLKNIASRINKKKYFTAKTIAVFISGALVVLIPLVMNILFVSAFVPSTMPFTGYIAYNYIGVSDMFADLYFSNPVLYVALYVLIDTIYGGIFALLSFAVSFYIKNIFVVLFLPFIMVIATGYIRNLAMQKVSGYLFVEFNPVIYLHSIMHGGVRYWWVIFGIAAILLVFSLCTIFIRGFRNEIF